MLRPGALDPCLRCRHLRPDSAPGQKVGSQRAPRSRVRAQSPRSSRRDFRICDLGGRRQKGAPELTYAHMPRRRRQSQRGRLRRGCARYPSSSCSRECLVRREVCPGRESCENRSFTTSGAWRAAVRCHRPLFAAYGSRGESESCAISAKRVRIRLYHADDRSDSEPASRAFCCRGGISGARVALRRQKRGSGERALSDC